MAKIGGFFVCLLILVLDIAAGMCGIEAEIAANKVKHLKMWIFECRSPSNEAFKLGLAAAGLMAIAHVIANLAGGCMGICSQEDLNKSASNRQLTTACFLFTWLILIVGMSTLAIGILANEKARAKCGLTHHHMFAIGGLLCFVHGLFSIAYYVLASSSAME